MKRFLTLSLFLAALVSVSCIKEMQDALPHPEPYPEGAKVTLAFTVENEEPGKSGYATKTLGEEPLMETLHLAVFGSSGYLKEYVKAQPLERISDTTYVDLEGINRTVARYSFAVTLTLSDNPRYVHFIGNGPATLPFGYAEAVLSSLLSAQGSQAFWQMKQIDGIRALRSESSYTDSNGNRVRPGDFIDKDGNKILNGRGYVPDAATLKAFSGIPMIRNCSKIVLSSEEDSYFTPYSFAVVNVPARGTIVPHCAETGFVTDYQLKSFEDLEEMNYTSNLPGGTSFDGSVPTGENFINGTGGVALAGEGAVYLYERPVPSEQIPPTYLIIYGHYENPSDLEHKGDYYYKVDLMTGDRYYPVYRNFKYQIVIRKILSQGHHSPEAAAAAAGSADVSADINASHLTDISDGQGRLAVQPWIAHTFTRAQTDNQLLHAYFMDDVQEAHTSMDAAAVTVEKLPMPYGMPDIITSLSIDPPSTDETDYGWRTIHFSTVEPGTTVRTQTIRITGRHEYGRLYRDIVITIQPIQPMIVSCEKKRIAGIKGSEQSVNISIPDGLSESMFPLVFTIEPEDKSLTPDGSKINNNLPVASGTSISGHAEYSGKSTFHYIRTLPWDEYRSLPVSRDSDEKTWRTVSCYFKSNCDESATTIWVQNEYFETASDSFSNFRILTFRNLAFNTSIPRAEDARVSLHFDVDEDSFNTYPDDYPVITIFPSGMIPASEDDFIPGELPGTWSFKPSSSSVDIDFITTTDDGDLYLEVFADEYESQSLKSHTFRGFGFIDGHNMINSSTTWSNVACGRVNSDKNKTVLFGYFDDPDAPNAEISLAGFKGLVNKTPSSYPWRPSGPRSSTGIQTYHEIEFRTPASVSLNPIEFTLCAPGYVEEYVRTPRFSGNIMTQDKIDTGTMFTPSNSYGFSVDNPVFTVSLGNGNNCSVSFDNISELRTATPAGLIIPAGESCNITVSSTPGQFKLFYVQFNIRTNVNWEGSRRNLAPKSGEPLTGTFSAYSGSNDQYLWNLPEGTETATLRLTAPDDCPINITKMVIKTYRGTLYN